MLVSRVGDECCGGLVDRVFDPDVARRSRGSNEKHLSPFAFQLLSRTSGASEGTFTNKPTVLADNGHGTKVKLRPSDGPGQLGTPNVAIERSFKRKGSDQWKTQKVSINGQDLLAVARGLKEGRDAILEKQIGK